METTNDANDGGTTRSVDDPWSTARSRNVGVAIKGRVTRLVVHHGCAGQWIPADLGGIGRHRDFGP